MEAVIAEIYPDSLAHKLGFLTGDRILRINGIIPADLIQWQWEWAGEDVSLDVSGRAGYRSYAIHKKYDESLGVQFEMPVFDGIRTCANACLFCFIDQMPPGCRESLYLKDDDYRLSFLQGSYVTLTNLSEADLRRIEGEKLSPLYVSVHASDPAVRSRMLGRPGPDQLMEILDRLSRAGVSFHSQIVLCPGYNDGNVLMRTIEDLSRIEGALSIAVVPVGLTRHRQGLAKLKPVCHDEAKTLIRWLSLAQANYYKKRGTRFIWLSDEFYILAGEEIPAGETYEDYPQWENGVGLIRSLLDEATAYELPEAITRKEPMLLVGGISAMHALEPLWERLRKIKGLVVTLLPIENRFFGPSVTVSGLLTGKCLIEGLCTRNLPPGAAIYLPDVMVRGREGRFLDGMAVSEVSGILERELVFLPGSGYGILAKLMEGRI